MNDILSSLGAVASIISASVACYFAWKAKSYATQAKMQIANRRRISELSRLTQQWDEVYKSLAIFGPSANPSELRGQDTRKVRRKVQDYLKSIKGCGASLRSIPDLNDRLDKLNYKLNEFSSAKTDAEKKEKGTALLLGLGDLDESINILLVSDREEVSLS